MQPNLHSIVVILSTQEGPHGVEHWWRYSVLLQNLGDVSLQLRERNWCVFSNKGTRESVTGRGVVGQVLPLANFIVFSSAEITSLLSPRLKYEFLNSSVLHLLLSHRSQLWKPMSRFSTVLTCPYAQNPGTCGAPISWSKRGESLWLLKYRHFS